MTIIWEIQFFAEAGLGVDYPDQIEDQIMLELNEDYFYDKKSDAMNVIRKLKEDKRVYWVRLHRFEIAKLPKKDLICLLLNKRGFVKRESRKIVYEWKSDD